MLVQVVLARMLVPEAFGILAILLVITGVADSIAQSGLGMALIQRSEATDDDYSTAFWLSLGIAVILYVAIFAVAPLLASFYGQPDFSQLLQALSIIVVLNSVNSVQRAFLQRSMDFKALFEANVAAVVVSGILGIGAATFGLGVWALVIQTVSQSAITCVVLLIVVSWKPSLRFNVRSAGELLSYGWKLCVTGILNVLYTGLSELVIGKTCSIGDLGYYSQGRKWPNAAISVATNALQNVFFPAFSSIRNDRQALLGAVRRALVTGSFVVVPISFFFAVAAEPIVALLLTEKWLPSVPVFQMLCLSGSFTLLQIVNLRAYMALGDSGLYLKLQIVKVVLGGIVICAVAILTQDIYKVSLATMFAVVLSILIVDLQPAGKMLGYPRIVQIKEVLPVYGLSGLSALAAWAVSLTGLSYVLLLAMEAFVFFAVYLAMSKFLKLEGLDVCLQVAHRLLGKRP